MKNEKANFATKRLQPKTSDFCKNDTLNHVFFQERYSKLYTKCQLGMYVSNYVVTEMQNYT